MIAAQRNGSSRRAGPNVRREERSEELLTVSTTLFNQKSYAATSMQDVADAVGLLKGSLYHYVDSKEELLCTIIRRHHDEFVRDVVTPSLSHDSRRAQFDKWITLHALFLCEHNERARIFMEDFRFLSDERRAEIMPLRREVEAAFRGILEGGRSEGWVTVSVEVDFLLRSIFTMINYSFVWYRLEGRWTAKAFAERHLELALALVGA